jgi:arylsulfatase A-like enzyme
MAADARTLPDILGLYGYTTAVFYGTTLPATFPAMQRGFAEHGDAPAAKPDGDAAREVVQWLDGSPKEPWLALVHTADLHLMGDVPRDDLDLYAPGHPPPCVEQGSLAYPLLVDTWATTLGRPAAEELLRAHYDAVVHHYDADVGEMVAALEREGVRSRTVVVVLSDHGQELLEHGNADHGPPYEFNLRVPLVIDDPTHARPPARVATMVQTIDVAPTILQLADIPIDAAMDGRSLLPLFDGAEGYVERPVISITDPHRMAVRTPEWLLLRCQAAGCPRPHPHDASTGEPVLELYDLARDPTQITNLAGTGLAVERELTPILDALPTAGRRKTVDDGMSAEQEKVLRERGYWDAGQ